MQKNRIPNKRNKKYKPKAFIGTKGEVAAPTSLFKKVIKVVLIGIASILLIATIILKIRHYLVKHW